MGFRGEEFVFGSPGAAVAGMVSRLAGSGVSKVEVCELERGRVLAKAVLADRDSPPFDYSSRDGYAVRRADISGWGEGSGREQSLILPVVGEARIGCEPPVMPASGGAVRIATGAAIPVGADVVIKREDVVEGSDGSVTMSRAKALLFGADFIRRRGENGRAGSEVLGAGSLLTGAAIGTLAAVGCARPEVFARVRIAVITTGDEVVAVEGSPSAFEIRNSNGPAVASLLAAHPWIEVVSVVHVRDDGELPGAYGAALAAADAVILTGGVSMGHRDPVRGVIEANGAQIVFHGLPQRPGMPMLGAVVRRVDGSLMPVFGLPGNPVSAMVTTVRIVVPVLASIGGIMRWPEAVRVALRKVDGNLLDLWWHRLVRMSERGMELVDQRGSGDVVAVGRCDGFVEVPPDTAGTGPFAFYPWP